MPNVKQEELDEFNKEIESLKADTFELINSYKVSKDKFKELNKQHVELYNQAKLLKAFVVSQGMIDDYLDYVREYENGKRHKFTDI